jgi:hypothetical protein
MEENKREFIINQYDDIWLKNGLANYHFILKSISEVQPELIQITISQDKYKYQISDIEQFVKLLSEKIVVLRGQRLIVEEEDKKTKARKEVKKDYVLIQEGSKINGKVKLKETLYDPDKRIVEKLLSDIFKSLNGESKKSCITCGGSFEKTVKKMQQASYPFTTKIKSLNGIRTGNPVKLKEYNDDYCPHCYLFGILQWLDDTMIYRTIPRDKSVLILPDGNSLTELIEEKSSIRKARIQNNLKRWSNIKVRIEAEETESTPGKYSTLIAFYEKLLHEIKSTAFLDWQIISIPSGTVKNPKLQKIRFEKNIVNTLNDLTHEEDILYYSDFVKEFYAFNNDIKNGLRDFEMEKGLHEKLCEAMIFDNFDTFTRCFLPSKGHHIGLTKESYEDLGKILFVWRVRQMRIENKEEYIKQIRLAGITIASLVENHLGLFFKMEKTKTLSDFLCVIQECSRRLTIDKEKFARNKKEAEEHPERRRVYPYSIDFVIEELTRYSDDIQFFKDTKNLILIYAGLRVFKKSNEAKEDTNE